MLIDFLILLSPSLAIGFLLFLRHQWRKRKQDVRYPHEDPRKEVEVMRPARIEATDEMETFRDTSSISLSPKPEKAAPKTKSSGMGSLTATSQLPQGARKEPPLTRA
jgi:hypothetical protein